MHPWEAMKVLSKREHAAVLLPSVSVLREKLPDCLVHAAEYSVLVLKLIHRSLSRTVLVVSLQRLTLSEPNISNLTRLAVK